MKIPTLLTLTLSAVAVTAANPTVYLIRHGEKPADGSNGLSTQGQSRAQCLRSVFSPQSQYNIGYILAQQPKSDGSRVRPLQTVTPLANSLGLSVDTHCDRDDSKCVVKAVQGWKGTGDILICWEHDALTDIVNALADANGHDDNDAPDYPDSRFDVIWTDRSTYKGVSDQRSECCPGLDSC